MDISVVVPVYGCKDALRELYDRLTQTLSNLVDEYEIILVNDNCPQGSWEVIRMICEEDERVVGINLSRNFGQGCAVTAGMDYSKGDWVVCMDCDLQDRPEEITNLYNKACEGYDIVFANRKDRKDSAFKKSISKCFYKLYNFLTDVSFNFEWSNFSISRRIVVDSFCNMRECHRDYAMNIYWLGFKQTSIDVLTDFRRTGKSSYSLSKKVKLAEILLTSQSDKLLRITAYLGFAITILSLVYIVFLIFQYFLMDINDGWTSIIATILFIGGLLLTSIGISGIYIGNIYMQTKNRPLYVIRDIINEEGK